VVDRCRTIGTPTDRIKRSVVEALHALGLGGLPSDIEKVLRTTQKIEKRQEQAIQAEIRSLASRTSAYRSNME